MVTPPRILFELRARAAGGRSGIPSSCRPVCKVEKRMRGWFPVIVATGGGAMGGAGGTAFLDGMCSSNLAYGTRSVVIESICIGSDPPPESADRRRRPRGTASVV